MLFYLLSLYDNMLLQFFLSLCFDLTHVQAFFGATTFIYASFPCRKSMATVLRRGLGLEIVFTFGKALG